MLLDLGNRTIEADCLWRERRLIVELDGHEVHELGPPSRATVSEIVRSRLRVGMLCG